MMDGLISRFEDEIELLRASTKTEKTTYTRGEILTLPPDNEGWLVKNLLRRSGLSVLAGPPDAGKSMLCLQLLHHVEREDSQFLGFEMRLKHGTTLMVSTEDNIADVQSRLSKMEVRFPLGNAASEGTRFCFPTEISLDGVAEAIQKELVRSPVDLVVVDGLGDIMDGNENSNSDVRHTMNVLQGLSREFDTQLLLIHHLRKSSKGESPDATNVQGGGAIVQKARTVLTLHKEENTHLRYLSIVKGNQISEDVKSKSTELRFDPDSLTFEPTGNQKSRSDVGLATPNRNGPKYDWSAVFRVTDATLPRYELIERLKASGVPYGTANRYIVNQLQKVDRGEYANPTFTHPEPPDRE